MTRIAVLGGGPGGYEAALVAAQLGAEVIVVDRDGLGGACVLTDCVPSKTLVATSEAMTNFADSQPLGVRLRSGSATDQQVTVDLPAVNARVKALALAQSLDIARRVGREGVEVVRGTARLVGPNRLVVRTDDGEQGYGADVVLIATGASPRRLADAEPDGERILDAALRVRADAPYACKGGVCGTCRAKLVSGTVRMDQHYALEQAELDAGFVLACQSHPTSERVLLDFDQ